MTKDPNGATKEVIAKRRRAYLDRFDLKHPAARIVMEDLAKFCRANETTYHPDPRLSDILQGRREVFLRIQQHLNLTDEDAWALYTGVALRPDATKSLVPVTITEDGDEENG